MKKWFFSLLLILFVITGCSEVSNNKPNESSDTQVVTTREDSQSVEANDTSSTDNTDNKTNEKVDSNQVSEYPTFEATIVSVSDGDTFTISFNNRKEKIRLLLVDTPEVVDPRKEVQKFGPEASAFTKSLLKPGTKVVVEKDISERDKYGRFLAYVYIDGKMLNELLLEKGLARVAYIYSPNTRYVDQFKEIQDKARQEKVGIWSIEDYVHTNGFSSNPSNKEESTPISSGSNGISFENNISDDKETNTSCKGKIKGNANSNVYHVPGGSYYDSTADNITWFCTEDEAQKAGFRKSKR